MARKIVTGIDIGTHQVKVVMAELLKDDNGKISPHIIGRGIADSKGIRHGYIVNPEDTVKSVRRALDQAEKTSGHKIKKVYVSIGGISLEGVIAYGNTIISKGDSEVTELDVKKAIESSEEVNQFTNRKIIHTIPIQYKIDGKEVLGRPVGMKGNKIRVKTLFITYLEQHLNDLIQTVENTGVEVEDVIASPVAASFVTLTKSQKIAGCVLANLGAETSSIIVFENNIPISLEFFPIGSTNITNDIALELKISLEEADKMKIENTPDSLYSKKKLNEIVTTRLNSVFKLIEEHLKKIERNGLLPAGIIITGGCSGITTIEDLAKASLNIPSKIASLQFINRNDPIKDSTWAVAYGLCVLGLTSNNESTGVKLVKDTSNKIIEWVKQFLP